VYVVFCQDPCECEVQCECQRPELVSIHADKADAEKMAKEYYEGHVEEKGILFKDR